MMVTQTITFSPQISNWRRAATSAMSHGIGTPTITRISTEQSNVTTRAASSDAQSTRPRAGSSRDNGPTSQLVIA